MPEIKRVTLSLPEGIHARLQEYIFKKKLSHRQQSDAISNLVDVGLKAEGY